MCTDVTCNNISKMKSIFSLAALYLLTQVSLVNSEHFRYDERIIGCIPISNPSMNTLTEYNEIQIITDLIHLPLRDIARRAIVSEKNASYNRFLYCSWVRYEYQTKHGDVIFDAIERVLRDALAREVGGTGPGMNLSKVEAKRFVNNCKHIKGFTPGITAVKVQNCILAQIKYLAEA